jgi:alkylhydroperoxidase family enzyme
VREAHPSDGWRSPANDRVGITIAQPKDKATREAVAAKCCSSLEISMPLLVDEMDDRVGHAYSGMPDRLYVIDRQGKVAYKGGRGPFGFKPGEMEQSIIMLLLDEAAPEDKPIAKPAVGAKPEDSKKLTLTDEEAWKAMPALEKGDKSPLPAWAPILARSLPKTTALMLELDTVQRTRSSLDPKLRGLMRLVAAKANQCNYTQAYALADLERAGLPRAEALAVTQDHSHAPQSWRPALHFAKKLTVAAYTVTDEEFAHLLRTHGEKDVVAMVHLLAYANFQDRLVQGLGLEVEEGGPLPPLDVRFVRKSEQMAPPRRAPDRPPNNTVPERITDPEWLAADFDTLQKAMSAQRDRPPRIRVPSWEEVAQNAPSYYPRNRPSAIRWGLVSYGYSPELTNAWLECMRTFGQEAKQDRVFEECLFWVVTRSLNCFY